MKNGGWVEQSKESDISIQNPINIFIWKCQISLFMALESFYLFPSLSFSVSLFLPLSLSLFPLSLFVSLFLSPSLSSSLRLSLSHCLSVSLSLSLLINPSVLLFQRSWSAWPALTRPWTSPCWRSGPPLSWSVSASCVSSSCPETGSGSTASSPRGRTPRWRQTPRGRGVHAIPDLPNLQLLFVTSLNRESLKFGIHTFSDIAEFVTHQRTCTCMCLNKTLLGEIYSLLIFNTWLRTY